MYGVGENLDIGIDVEQLLLTTAWTRYSLINNPNGFSLAGNAAVFLADGEVASNGWCTGILLCNQFNPNLRLAAGARYAVLDQEYGDFGAHS